MRRIYGVPAWFKQRAGERAKERAIRRAKVRDRGATEDRDFNRVAIAFKRAS